MVEVCKWEEDLGFQEEVYKISFLPFCLLGILGLDFILESFRNYTCTTILVCLLKLNKREKIKKISVFERRFFRQNVSIFSLPLQEIRDPEACLNSGFFC